MSSVSGMKVLCATDFSEEAARAAHTAALLARAFGDTLVLVHVIEATFFYPPDPVTLVVDIVKTQRTLAAQGLKDLAEELSKLGVPVETQLAEGSPDLVVVDVAKELGARLIAVGSRGRGAIERHLVGSTAERMVRRASCPVLVVRDAADALNAGLEHKTPLKILVGVDFCRSSQGAIQWVKELRRQLAADLIFAHVYWPPAELVRLGLSGARDLGAADPEVEGVLDRQLWKLVGEMPGQGEVALRVRSNWGRVAPVLSEIAAGEHASLLVVGTHQPRGADRFWHGSMAQAVLLSSKAPVLCVPLAAAHHKERQAIPVMHAVLAPTDLSPLGNEGVAHAYALVRGGGHVELCHVVEQSFPGLAHPLSPEERRRLEGQLAKLVPADADYHGVTTHVSVLEDVEAARAIAAAAERLDVDAICLASRGRAGIAKMVLGSVAQRLLSYSARPIVVIRRPPA